MAEQLLGKDDSKERVVELVNQALQQDAWRMHRIRPFDWYATEQKKQVALETRLAQWRGWGILVRHYRALHEDSKAQQLLAETQDRLDRIKAEQDPQLFWTGAATVVELCATGGEWGKARQLLGRMERELKAKPDRKRSAELTQIKARLTRLERVARKKPQQAANR
jgi:hypothetical protein